MTYDEWIHYVAQYQGAYLPIDALEHILEDWRDERNVYIAQEEEE